MKKYKVTFDELDRNTKYSYPECVKDIVQKQINKVNRSISFSKRELESRSSTSQEILYTLKQLPKKDILRIETAIKQDRDKQDYNYEGVRKMLHRVLNKHSLCFGSLDLRLNEVISLVMSFKLY